MSSSNYLWNLIAIDNRQQDYVAWAWKQEAKGMENEILKTQKHLISATQLLAHTLNKLDLYE